MSECVVVGAGVFGLTTALELRARGLEVTVVDPGPVPHPLAESTDISKVVRLDYGADADYTELGERALEGWRRWNASWPRPLFHETGVTFLARAPMRPGGFEHDSYALLTRRGHPLERLDATQIAARFPAYRPGAMVDGYFNPVGGWAESGAVVAQLAHQAIAAGVVLRGDVAVVRIDEDGVVLVRVRGHEGSDAVVARARGDEASDDSVEPSREEDAPDPVGTERLNADLLIVCAGAWVPRLLPELAPSLHAIGQPVFHLRPADPTLFEAVRFPVFGADISQTGYYGFPVTPDGIVKIANHGTGVPVARDQDRVVDAAHEAALRAFLSTTFPALVAAPIVARRLCVYCDTIDEHFWIARHPQRPNLVVATGGSGHAFKFAPVLGPVIADIALGVAHPLAHRFRWRPELAGRRGGDAARHR